MTFNAPSFFAGVGTVLGILVVGFGGGVLMSSVVMDKGPRPPSKIEQHAAEAAKPPVVTPSPVPVTEAKDLAPAPAPQPVQTPVPALQAEPQVPVQPQPQVRPPSMIAAPSGDTTAPLGPQQPVALVNPEQEPRSAQPDARAKAQEAKRAAAEKKKLEQRKRAEKQLQQQQRQQQQQQAAAARANPQDLDDDEPEERPFFTRRERDRAFDRPIFRLFGND